MREILEIVDRLLDGVQLEAHDGEVRERVRKAIEPVLEDNGGALFLLRDLAIDSPVCEVTIKA